MDCGRGPLRRVVSVVEQVARKQGPGIAEKRDQWAGDDHRRVVERRDRTMAAAVETTGTIQAVLTRGVVMLAISCDGGGAIGKDGAEARGDRR